MAGELLTLVKTALIEELEQLRKAAQEVVEPLPDDRLWQRPLEPGNSMGHLVLHLAGNLNHFVGGQLGGSGYVRNREHEFTASDRPAKDVLLAHLDEAVATFRRVVNGLGEDDLARPHPEARLGTVLQALVHLVAHFALHRGQMTYIARLVTPRDAH